MARSEGIVLGFIPPTKRSQAVLLSNRENPVVSARQNLVDIGLMTGIPHHFVPGCVEDVMKSHRELRHTEGGTKVPSHLRHHIDMTLPSLPDQLMEFFPGKFLDVFGALNPF
jgi:hypothetical protein